MDILIYVLIVVAALGLAAVIYRRGKKHADRINDYFLYALIAYTRFNDEDAKAAAIAAAKVVNRETRNSYIAGTRAYISELTKAVSDNNPELQSTIEKLLEIEQEISAKDWTVIDSSHEKQRLFERNPEYLKALNRADPDVFVRKYGDLSRF